MIWVTGAIALGVLVGLVVLARTVARSGGPRTMLWLVLLATGVALASVLGQLASIYYKLPLGWILILVLAAVVLIALFVGVARDLSWKPLPMFGVVGVLVGALIITTMVMIALPSGGLMKPLFEIRAQQIAEAAGFDVLVPAGIELETDFGLPVNAVGEVDGVALHYSWLTLVERAVDGPLDHADLKKRMPVGSDPLDFEDIEAGRRGPGIPNDAEYVELEVGDRPALGVAYRSVTEEKPGTSTIPDPLNALIFERDGIEVRMLSQGGMDYQSDGSYVQRPPLTFDELIELAESLEPLGQR